MNPTKATELDESFPPTLPKSGYWICARYTQIDLFSMDVRVWEAADYMNEKMKSLHFLGLVLKALHLAQGGDPAHSEGLVTMTSPLSLPLPNGTVHSTVVRPTSKTWNEKSRAQAWEFLRCDLQALTGMLGEVTNEDIGSGLQRLVVDFGPANLGKAPKAPPADRYSPVEMSTTLRPSSLFKPGA